MKRHRFRARFVQTVLMGLSALMVSGSTLANDFTWTATSGTNNYNVPGNWDLNAVPGGGDRAFITTTGNYSVILSDSRSIADFTLGATGVTLNHNDGLFSISNSININAGTYVINGLSAWSMQAGSSINIANGATVNTFTQNSSGITGAATINNAGTINGMSRGDFAISVTGNFTNSGTIHADNPQGFATSNLVIQNTGDFTNNGILSASSGISLGSPNQITLKPTGNLNLNTGIGSISVTNGGAIYIARDIPFASLGSWSITNTGSFGMTNGGTLTMGVGDTLTIDATKSSFTLNIGNIKGGSIDATNGILVIRGTNDPAQINTLENVTNIRGTLDMSTQNAVLALKGANFGTGAVINQATGTLHINQQSQIDNVTVNAGGDFSGTAIVLDPNSHLHIGPTAFFSLGGQNAPGLVGTGDVTNDGTILVRSRGNYPFTFTGNFVNNGTLHGDNPFGFAGSNMLIQNQGNFSNNGILSVNGNETQGQLVRNTITINPSGTVTLGTNSQLFMTNTGQIIFAGSAVTNQGIISINTGSFLQVGGGTGTLMNEKTVVNNGLFDGNMVTTSSGTLTGSGSITGTATIIGTIAPGNSPGSITVAAGIQLQGDYQWDLGSHTTQGAGTNFDQIKLTAGVLNISNAATLHLHLPDGTTLIDPFWAQPREWTIIDNLNAANTISGIIAADRIFVGAQPNGFFDTFIGGTDGNDLILRWSYVAVPEPTTWLLIGLSLSGGLAGAYSWQRRRQKILNQLVEEEVCLLE